jgi:hypothetical protein
MTNFVVSPSNPNAEQGGGDLCYPHKQVEDAVGPWVVFPAVDVAEHAGPLPLPHAALPLSFLKEAVAACEGIEPQGVPVEQDIRKRIAAQAEPNADFADLDADEQAAIVERWPGQVVKTSVGYVQVPGRAPAPGRELRDIAPIEAPEPAQQVPAGPGEYVDVVEFVDDEDEAPEV